MLDLKPFKETDHDLHYDDGYTDLGKLNLAAWLGERASLLIDEIETTRKLLSDLVGDYPDGVTSNALEAAKEYLGQ